MRLLYMIGSCVLLALVATGEVLALSIADRTVSELYEDAQAITEARITEIEGKCVSNRECPGYRLGAVVKRMLKGSAPATSTISICSLIPLDLNVTYTLFLFDAKDSPADDYRCKYILSRDGAFEKRGDYTYRVRSHESAVIVARFGESYYTDAIRVTDFDEKLAENFSAKD